MFVWYNVVKKEKKSCVGFWILCGFLCKNGVGLVLIDLGCWFVGWFSEV